MYQMSALWNAFCQRLPRRGKQMTGKTKFGKYENALYGIDGLAVAVVVQAVNDWRRLCDGGEETDKCNFIELECFFENEAKGYLDGTNTSADRILKILLREKAESNYLEKRRAKQAKAQARKRKRMFY